MAIRDVADKMHGIKRIEGEYATKKEYRRYRKNEIMEEWNDKKEDAREKLEKMHAEKSLYQIFE